MAKAGVALLMGSKSDESKLQKTIDTLDGLEIPRVIRVMSAHRTPARVASFVSEAPKQHNTKVFIAAAGGAAHLAGQVAAHTTLPVIGVPLEGGALNGVDSLYSTVQMPGGIPVATVGIGNSGATNAALLAAQILSVADGELQQRVISYRQEQEKKVISHDEEIQQQYQ